MGETNGESLRAYSQMTLKGLRNRLVGGLPAINLQAEVEPYLSHLKGLVLNAGAGHRPVDTRLPTLTTDFDESAPVDFLCDLHYLPLQDACIDSVLSVAVLEHTRLPWECCRELWRVLKPGGTAVIGVPFLQPEHAVPHDFFRYTVYGVHSMLEWAGFQVTSVTRIGRQHRALAWTLLEMGRQYPRLFRWSVAALATFLARRARTGDFPPASVYTGSYAVARKPGHWEPPINPPMPDLHWFYHLLVDPVTKGGLEFTGGHLRNSQGDVYGYARSLLDLRPKRGLSQDRNVPWPGPRLAGSHRQG
jgi:SAM-dependent methyltransferase